MNTLHIILVALAACLFICSWRLFSLSKRSARLAEAYAEIERDARKRTEAAHDQLSQIDVGRRRHRR